MDFVGYIIFVLLSAIGAGWVTLAAMPLVILISYPMLAVLRGRPGLQTLFRDILGGTLLGCWVFVVLLFTNWLFGSSISVLTVVGAIYLIVLFVYSPFYSSGRSSILAFMIGIVVFLVLSLRHT